MAEPNFGAQATENQPENPQHNPFAEDEQFDPNIPMADAVEAQHADLGVYVFGQVDEPERHFEEVGSWEGFLALGQGLDEYDNYVRRQIVLTERWQEASTFHQRATRFFLGSEGEKQAYLRDGLIFQKLGKTIHAQFFNFDGQNLLPNEFSGFRTSGRVILRFEAHMPHIRLIATARKLDPADITLEDPGFEPGQGRSEKGSQPDEEEQVDDTTEAQTTAEPATEPADWDNNSEPPMEAQADVDDPIDEVMDGYEDIETFADDADDITESLVKAVYTLINYQAYEKISVIDYSNIDNLSTEAAEYLQHTMPVTIQDRIFEILAADGKPVLLEVRFNPDLAAHYRIYAATPLWARFFANEMKTGQMVAVLDAGDMTVPQLDVMGIKFKQNQLGKSPLKQFHHEGKRLMFTPKRLIHEPTIGKDNFDFQPRPVFFDADEYRTVFGIHVLSEQLALQDYALQFCSGTHKIRLVAVPGAGDRAYMGFMPIPEESSLRVTQGTRIKVNFVENLDDQGVSKPSWPAIVTSDAVTMGPREFIAFTINRPWNKGTRQFDGFGVHTISTRQRLVKESPNLILQDSGNKAVISIDISTKVGKNLLSAVEDMNFEAADKKKQEWNRRIEQVLLGTRIDKLKPRDIFASVRKDFPDVTKVMQLNDRQRQTVLNAATAPAGLLLIQGPPGTGKSKMLREIAKPFFRASDDTASPILAISPSNVAVDAVAAGMAGQLKALQKAGLVPANRYILRLYSKGSEKAIREREAKKTRPENPARRPLTFPEEVIVHELEEINREIYKTYKSETATKFEGIPDRRVNYPELSAGRKMLEITGVIRGPATHPDETRFADFRDNYRYFAQGQEVNKNVFEEAMNDAWAVTLRGAAMVVSTTTTAGLAQVVGQLLDVTRVILLDEAAHEAEHNLQPFFSARFTELDGMVQVGDWQQLLPAATVTPKESVFAAQVRMSFMARLIAVGFPVSDLNEQFRMVDDICNLANELTYKGRLLVSPLAKADRRQVAQVFRSFAARHIAKASNVMFVDILKGPVNKTEFNQSQSRYNDLFVVTEATLAEQLLRLHSKATVAILTGYKAQKARLIQVKVNMARYDFRQAERLTVETFDGSQGEQYDYVIVDILVNASGASLGFQVDPHRMNVALTRARNGLIVLADVHAIKACSSDGRGFVARLINQLAPYRTTVPGCSTLPANPYYHPQKISGIIQDARSAFDVLLTQQLATSRMEREA